MSDRSWRELKTLSTLIIASLFLSGAAIYNGYPMVYPDTGGYIGLQNLSFRSFFYNLFIYPSIWFHSLWLIVFAQSLIVAHILRLALRVVFRVTSLTSYILIIASLCLLTCLPWITGFIMPDIFSGIMIISLYLLFFCGEKLESRERIYLFLLTSLCATVHLSNIPLAVGMIGVVWFFRLIFNNNSRFPAPRLFGATLAILLAFILIIANNYRTHHVFTFSPGGYAFILARLVADGPAVKYLERSCPEKKYKLCDYLGELPSDSNKFLWQQESPFRKVGWFDGYQREGKEIVSGTILLYPLDVAGKCVKNTFLQLIKFLTFRYSYLDKTYVTNPIRSYFPNEYDDFENSKQNRNQLNLKGLNYLHLAVVAFSFLAAGLAFLIFWRQSQSLPALFLLFVGAAYLINALITGCLSIPDHRFGGRIIWLVPFFSMASLKHIMDNLKENVRILPHAGKGENGR